MSIMCAILVATIHAVWTTDKVCLTWFINELVAQGIARIAVPFFFVISGFFLAAHFDNRNWYAQEVKKRVGSLVVPFVIWSAVGIFLAPPLSIMGNIIEHRPPFVKFTSGNWMSSFGLDLSAPPWLLQLWYVRCLFFFVLLSPIFKLCIEKFRLWWLVFTFIVATAFDYIAIRPFWYGFLSYGISLSGIFYFSVGIYLRRFHVAFHSTPLAIASGIYGGCWLLIKTYAHAHGLALPSSIGCLSLPALMFAIWHIIPTQQFPTWLTSCSFSIFLLHCIFLGCATTVMRHFPLDKQIDMIIAFFLAIIASVIFTHLLHKISPKLTNFLFAGRS